MRRDDELRLAELLGILSLATDLGLGQPMEHVLRSCIIAVRLGERVGLDDDELAALYYVALLAFIGCTADAYEVAKWFGDDIAFKAGMYDIDFVGAPAVAYMLRRVGSDKPPWTRARLAAALLTTGGKSIEAAMVESCQSAGLFAQRLDLGDDVQHALQHNFARWDGKGLPAKLGGDDIALLMRIVHVAELVEVHHRVSGVEEASAIARKRSGTVLDPMLAEAFCESAHEILADLDDGSHWDEALALAPALDRPLSGDAVDVALEAVADFIDLKSPFLAGHSRGVAELAVGAARHAGLRDPEVTALRRAALLHDIGRTGVPNTIWDKPGPLTAGEWERVRLHAYYTERMLARPALLARLAGIAGGHHERCDGSGYHRGASGEALTATARILAAADAYHAMLEPRPHRDAMTPEAAAGELRADVTAGRLDADAVNAVLAAAGHKVGRRRTGPSGLTAREIDVVIQLARGFSNKEIAARLHISPKTVARHLENIFTKLGIRTRTAAALYAMQHGLVDPLQPVDADPEVVAGA